MLLGIEAFVFEVIIDELFATVGIFDIEELIDILLIEVSRLFSCCI